MPCSPTSSPVLRQFAVRVEQLDGIDVENALRRSERSERRVCAAGTQEIANPQGLGPQGIRHQGDSISVAGDHVQDRLHALGGDQRGRGQRRHRHVIAVVADAHGVEFPGAAAGQLAHLRGISPLRRRNLGQQ